MAGWIGIVVLLFVGTVPAQGADQSPTPEGLVQDLLLAEKGAVRAVATALIEIGFPSVAPLLKARTSADERGCRRIDDLLVKLVGVTHAFPLPAEFVDPVSKASCRPARGALLTPALSCDAGRVVLSYKPKGDDEPPRIVVMQCRPPKVLLLIDGEEGRLSADGRVLAYLRPRGDDIHFYKTFYTQAAAVFYLGTRSGFVVDPRSTDNHLHLSFSADGTRVAYEARMTCLVRKAALGGRALLTTEGTCPSLSPDGRWLAWTDGEGRVALSGADACKPRVLGPPPPGREVAVLRCLSRRQGVVILASRKGNPQDRVLWGFSAGTGAQGRLSRGKGCADLSVGDNDRILWRSGSVAVKDRMGGKARKVTARATAAGLSPCGRFAVFLNRTTLHRVFLGL
jgi:hypothetical protein